MNFLRLPATFIAALVGALPLAAADYCVRAGASGANNGSDWNNAYTALPATLQRGATYFIADGTYAGRTFATAPSGTTPISIVKATTTTHGTGSGWVDTYGDGQAAFSGQLRFTTAYWLIDGATGGGAANRWAGVFGFKITDTGSAILRVDSAAAHDLTIRHVDLTGKGSPTIGSDPASNFGLAVYGAANVTLSHFRMTGIGNCPFFLSASNFVAEHGWVVSYFGDASAHSEIASIWDFAGNLGDVTFRHNLFTDIQSTGGLMWDNSSNTSARLLVYGNVFYKPVGAPWQQANGLIGGWTGGNGEEFRNTAVYHNTFINVDQQCLSTFPNVFSGNVAHNNLFYNCSSPDFARFATHDHNHFINAGGTHGEAGGTSSASGDPFVDFIHLDFRLKAATAAGASFAAPYNIDPLGVARGGDGTRDRGAYEYVAASNTAPTIATIADQTTTMGTAKAITVTVGDAQTAAGALSVTATSSNTALVPNVNLVVSGSSASRTLTITPASGQSGSTTITVVVTDGGGLSASDAFVLTVTGDTTAPATPAAPTVSGNGSSAPVLSGTTEAWATVTIRTGSVVVATVTANASGAWTWTVSGLTVGSHAITVSATDVAGNTSTASPATTVVVAAIPGGGSQAIRSRWSAAAFPPARLTGSDAQEDGAPVRALVWASHPYGPAKTLVG